nr:chondroitin sulfate synthase 3-like [Ciona intestinalis]|eukprot:XP_009861406.1 chondroitin sulfate synthase 3-like [Ciona intestinalis]
MAGGKQPKKQFVPFCAGIACGIFISIILFIGFATPAILKSLWKSSVAPVLPKEIKYNDHGYHPEIQPWEGNVVPSSINSTIPIDLEPEPVEVENPAWEVNLTPVHIPGFLLQELKLKKKVFVGVINPSVVNTPNIELILKTWAKDWMENGDGDITIYTPMGVDITKTKKANIYYLSDVHNQFSLQNLQEGTISMIYQTLEDICSQHIDAYHHFFVVGGNTYVSLDKLLNFTKRLDDSSVLWIGHKEDTKDRFKHFINEPSSYCSSGPGFVLSRQALQLLCPRLPSCQRDYGSNTVPPGLQLARCVKRFLNTSCTYTDKDIFYKSPITPDPYSTSHPYDDSITVHPVLDDVTMFKLHHFFLSQQLNETIRSNEYLHNIIQTMDRVLVQEGGMSDDRLILGRNGNENKYRHGDVITWDRVEHGKGKTPDEILVVSEAEPKRELSKSDKISMDKVKVAAMTHYKEKLGDAREVKAGDIFRRVVPGVGYQYMVDVLSGKDEVATVCLDQPYGRMTTIRSHTSPNVKVNFVLPLLEGSPYFKDFMQMFEQACMSIDRAQNVALLVVLYTPGSGNGSFDEKNSDTLTQLNLYKQKYPALSLRWINAGDRPFSSIGGTWMAVKALPADTLLCSTDLFMLMSPEYLHHARLNTVPGERLSFPVPFQRVLPLDNDDEGISRSSGFWRSFDYGLFCGYKQDIMRACEGQNFASGADLYERALSTGLNVFRAPEHALSIGWHERECRDEQLSVDEQRNCEEMNKNLNLASSAIN